MDKMGSAFSKKKKDKKNAENDRLNRRLSVAGGEHAHPLCLHLSQACHLRELQCCIKKRGQMGAMRVLDAGMCRMTYACSAASLHLCTSGMCTRLHCRWACKRCKSWHVSRGCSAHIERLTQALFVERT